MVHFRSEWQRPASKHRADLRALPQHYEVLYPVDDLLSNRRSIASRQSFHSKFTGLVILAQEKDAQIRRTKTALKAAEDKAAIERADAAASPLDTAQRSVIRNLGLKVSTLSQQVAAMKEERDLAQVRPDHRYYVCS